MEKNKEKPVEKAVSKEQAKPKKTAGKTQKKSGGNQKNYERKIKSLEDRLKNRENEIKALKKRLAERESLDREKLLDFLMNLYEFVNGNENTLKRNREIKELSKLFNTFFHENSLKLFGRKGEKYDERKHEALLFLNDEVILPGRIVKVKSPGVRKGRVTIRKARVLVSKTRS
jgi:molecular chaperone GrpE (heat shock protein)